MTYLIAAPFAAWAVVTSYFERRNFPLAWAAFVTTFVMIPPPGRYATEYADRPYDGTVAWSDEVVGRLIEALRTAGTLDNTLVIVTSDHGEALGEHGEDVHGYFVYEATLRVPLVVRGPGVKPGTRLEGLARTIDFFPTIVEMTRLGGAATPTSGRSLAHALGERRATTLLLCRVARAAAALRLERSARRARRAVEDILAPRPELYDLDKDPGELKNLVDTDPAKASAMRASLEARLAREDDGANRNAAAGVSPEQLERLGALGYVGAGRPVPPKRVGSEQRRSGSEGKLADYKALSRSCSRGSSRSAPAVRPTPGAAAGRGQARHRQLRVALLPGARLRRPSNAGARRPPSTNEPSPASRATSRPGADWA